MAHECWISENSIEAVSILSFFPMLLRPLKTIKKNEEYLISYSYQILSGYIGLGSSIVYIVYLYMYII